MRLARPLGLSAALVLAAIPAFAGGASSPQGQVFTSIVFSNAGGEPNVIVSPDGKVVLADGLGSQAPTDLFRSTDGGRHFTQVPVNVPVKGGGDWDMHFVSNRIVVAADLDLTAGIHVDVSRDAGLTWTETTVEADVYDRPWIGGSGQNVYLVTKGFDGIPYLYISHDLGKTFSSLPILIYGTGVVPAEAGGTSPTPVEALVTNQNAYVDNLVVDQRTGDVFVLYGIDSAQTYASTPPVGAPDRLYVAHLESAPGGALQMVSHPVYLGGAGDAFYAGFNWLAVDSAGTLYVSANGAHRGHQSAWLSYSKDRGRTWSPLVDVGTPHVASIYGAIAAGSAGNVSLVYYQGTKTDSNSVQDWYATEARITGANTPHPHVLRLRLTRLAVHTKDICLDGILCGVPGFGNNRALLDYIDDTIGPDGATHAVFSSDGPATGGGGVSVIYFRQVAGPDAGHPSQL